MGIFMHDHWAAAFGTLLLMVSTTYAVMHGGRPGVLEEGGDLEEGLELSRPNDVFRSEAGSLEVWSPEFRALRQAGVGADRITLEHRGLGLFKYSDAAKIAYVLEGKAKVGLSFPWDQSTHVRTVRKGDIIAIPRGVGHWWYNGNDDRFIVFGVADTSNNVNSGDYDSFYLAGGSAAKELGSGVLHGFDEELLSHAWDVDRDVVRQIRESQKDTVIVKVHNDIEIPSDSGSGDESKEIWEDFTFNVDEAQSDIQVNGGGSFSIVTSKKLPLLRDVRLSAIRVKLDPHALFAPSYRSNAHVLIYVTRGGGRIQVVGSGDQLLDTDVNEGSLVVVPQSHPDIRKAGTDGFEFVSIATSDEPIFSFLAGRNSIYRSVPVEVLAASNNVPVALEQNIFDHRQKDAVIFPPRGKSAGSVNEKVIDRLNGLFVNEDLKEISNNLNIRL